MLLHKAIQTSPKKVKRPMQVLNSRAATGRLGDTMYIKGGHGGFLRVPPSLSKGLIEHAERSLRAHQQKVWGVVVLLLVLALTVMVWRLG